MKKYIKLINGALLVSIFMLNACKLEPQIDPNSPSIDGFKNPTKGQVQNVITGTIGNLRTNLAFWIDPINVIGREYIRYTPSEPRWTSELLGAGGGGLDNNSFYTNGGYNASYNNIRNTNILIEGTTASTSLSAEEKKAALGFAKTFQALEFLRLAMHQWDGGLRLDVKDVDKVKAGVPFESKEKALELCSTLLNESAADLDAAGANLGGFKLPAGFAGLNTSAGFKKFNRALAARVFAYRGDWANAQSALAASFMNDAGATMKTGAYINYSTASGDALNPLFLVINAAGELRGADSTWIGLSEMMDSRLMKAKRRTTDAPAGNSGLKVRYDAQIYTSNQDPIAIIRREELLLLDAEVKANIGSLSDAATAINVVRVAAGASPYALPAGATKDDVITQILKERRLSLFGEGHRWIDMRRYGRLNQITVFRAGEIVHTKFPRPLFEK